MRLAATPEDLSRLSLEEVAQMAAGVCCKHGGLQIRILFCELGAQTGFRGRRLRIAKLAKDGRERGVRAGEIGLEADGFAQRIRRLLKFRLLLENGTECVERFGIIGLGGDGFF